MAEHFGIFFFPAVQLGLTATPKRKDNKDTYKYFGEPVCIYSMKEEINDGFLTSFKVKRIKTFLNDTTVEGEIEASKLYEEKDFNRSIEIEEREAKRNIYLDGANQNEKAIIFCAKQVHTLPSHTICPDHSGSHRSDQSLSKSVSVPTHGKQENAANFKNSKTDDKERQCTTNLYIKIWQSVYYLVFQPVSKALIT